MTAGFVLFLVYSSPNKERISASVSNVTRLGVFIIWCVSLPNQLATLSSGGLNIIKRWKDVFV